jgi:beta-galactosidase
MTASLFHVDPSKPRNRFSLNGMWEIQPGGEEVPAGGWNRSVPVPGLVDLALPAYDWRQQKYHWYRTMFKLDPPFSSGAALLTIEQAMFGTEVWLNGRRLGGDIACYTSQEYEIGGLLISGNENELLVRVGDRETLPVESAVGRDQERTEFVPGIWGDVHLTVCGNPRIKLVQIVPHIDKGVAETRLSVANRSGEEIAVDVALRVLEKRSESPASEFVTRRIVLHPDQERTLPIELRVRDPKLWAPGSPFLYELDAYVLDRQSILDRVLTTFGMREFRIEGPDFLLNGKPIRLRGGNIAFHRFLSDAGRGLLPWDLDWVKKLLIDIPQAHHFNLFRFHLGQAYNRWYDLADEHGMLIQNEWQFWSTTGSKEQIRKEFTRWLQDNWNHPSIVIWDPLNETTDPVVQNEIVPEMKKLDPTRPWESVDLTEQHPYIYSLGPVLVNRKFGFTASLEEIERSGTPSMVNEFLWWWLDKDFNPAPLTKDVVERWLGPHWSGEELVERQSFLAQELVELFRRMDVKAIQPFVYLSNNLGPTGNWFSGEIAGLTPKPVLAALKNAFAPFGLSIELWDRHFFTNERRRFRIFIFNDGKEARSGSVRVGIRNEQGMWVTKSEERVEVPGGERLVRSAVVGLPSEAGAYTVTAELVSGNDTVVAVSRKIAHVMTPPQAAAPLQQKRMRLLDLRGELTGYLASAGIATDDFRTSGLKGARTLLIGEGLIRDPSFRSGADQISRFMESGGTVVVIEPEFGVTAGEVQRIAGGIDLTIEPRNDVEKGGYDSYVFAESHAHPLWAGIPKGHLQMFNGGYGGEVVSEHLVSANLPITIHARCGMELKTAAVFEATGGGGRVLVSRLQLRGRLTGSNGSDSLFDRRPDPVLQQYLLNLLSYASQDD